MVKSPSDNLLIGDAQPGDNGTWSSSIWWPNASMTAPSLSTMYEGIEMVRHSGVGVMVFADAHSEVRKDCEDQPAGGSLQLRQTGVDQFQVLGSPEGGWRPITRQRTALLFPLHASAVPQYRCGKLQKG